MGEVHGFCDERFEPLRTLMRTNQERGIDEGASLAATLGGELVVDLWAGTTDRKRSRPWAEDTLVHVFSTSKVMVNLAVLIIYDRGLLDLDALGDLPAAAATAERGLAMAEPMGFGTLVWRLRTVRSLALDEPTDQAAAEFRTLADRIADPELRRWFERQPLAPT